MIKMIVAVGLNNEIGYTDGRLPWKCQTDMQRFKQLTSNEIVVMGRKTFQSLKRKLGLPNRKNVIISSTINQHIETVGDLPGVQYHGYWIIGGKMLYEDAIARGIVDEIYLSIVNTATNADVIMNIPLNKPDVFCIDYGYTLVEQEVHSDVTFYKLCKITTNS